MEIINRIKYHFNPNSIKNKEKKKFAKFGENSIIYLPRIADGYHELIQIGNNTTILQNSRIQLFPYLVEKTPHIIIGDRCYIGYFFSILAGADIVIGNDVLIASNVLISSENHGINPERDVPYMNQPLECKAISIGDGCWIGEKVCILPGVNIGEKCIVGAGSIVTKDIPDYSIAVGSPAKVIKRYNFENHDWEKV